MLEQQAQVGKEILRMPADKKADSQADNIPTGQKRVSGKASERLFRRLLFAPYRRMNIVRAIGVMTEIFAQPSCQMPHADHKQRHQNDSAGDPERLPQWRLDHRHEERGEEKRNRSEHRSLSFEILTPIIFQNLIYDSVPTRLCGDGARA